MEALPDSMIQITHCSERDFLDSFRSDLAAAIQAVLVLSPFLSSNRAVDYYPALHALTIRAVTVDVYSRAGHEQPEGLRKGYPEVIRTLRRLGVHVHVRPGMHEKVAAIDGRILWHGSLNILSHNDTRESMLRFECAGLVKEVLSDLGLDIAAATAAESPSQLADEARLGDKHQRDETRGCPICGDTMQFFESPNLWICNASPRCSGTLSYDSAPTTERLDVATLAPHTIELACPICASPMGVSRGVFVRISCTSPTCGFALDPRLSAGIARVLKQRSVA
jgi:hypothetical protein